MDGLERHRHSGVDSERVHYNTLRGDPPLYVDYTIYQLGSNAGFTATGGPPSVGTDSLGMSVIMPAFNTALRSKYLDTLGGPSIETKFFWELYPETAVVLVPKKTGTTDNTSAYIGVGWMNTNSIGTMEKHVGFRLYYAAGKDTFDLYTSTADDSTNTPIQEEKLVGTGYSNSVAYVMGWRHSPLGVSFYVNNLNLSMHSEQIPTRHIITALGDETLHYMAWDTDGVADTFKFTIRGWSLRHRIFTSTI